MLRSVFTALQALGVGSAGFALTWTLAISGLLYLAVAAGLCMLALTFLVILSNGRARGR